MSEHETEPTTEQGFWAQGRHPVNVGQLVMGLAFLGLVTVWVLLSADVADGDALSWLLPVPWLVAGAAGLLATTLGAARRRGPAQPAPGQDGR
ncbi:hypothetical protein I601_0287 [Nocardioides dokdonensis FR1436]|uniref:Uncharacterized protein n=1 Tax=Nocardioides dokdonensis FR1436 TaxID=1300347 RepID=A0A1A9GGC3_9ACTN|nr:hypothetical protein [Nocardioides dokdonensis]ANH36740.1 hypothetical protein I601_0287 [Nocardioides dokdonensis FR1436]